MWYEDCPNCERGLCIMTWKDYLKSKKQESRIVYEDHTASELLMAMAMNILDSI